MSMMFLNRREKLFCLLVAQLGEERAPDAFERAFMCLRTDDAWVVPKKDPEEIPESQRQEYIDTCEAAERQAKRRKSDRLLKREEIQDAIAEMKNSAPDMARSALVEGIVFGKDNTRLRSVSRILDDEDKIREKDAVVRFLEIACACGADVEYDDGTSIPMREFFPRFMNSMPPPDVIRKTIASLEEYVEMVEGREDG